MDNPQQREAATTPNPCKFCNKLHEGIGGYYDRIRCEGDAAYRAVAAARHAEAPLSLITRLEEWALQRSNTGD